MRDRESRDGLDQLPRVPGNQNKSEHKEQMIDTEKNVLDAELEIGSGDGPGALTSRDRCPRRTGRQSFYPFAAVGKLNAHEGVGHSARQAVDPHLLTCERLNCSQAPCLHHGVVRCPRNDRRRSLHAPGEADIKRQPGVALHRRLKEDFKNSGRDFSQLEIRRTNLVGERAAHGKDAGAKNQQPEDGSEMPACRRMAKRPDHCVFAPAGGGASK